MILSIFWVLSLFKINLYYDTCARLINKALVKLDKWEPSMLLLNDLEEKMKNKINKEAVIRKTNKYGKIKIIIQ